MKYVNELKENYSSRLIISGGKGANLHKLIHYNFNIPEGFIINTKAFTEYLRYNGLFSPIKDELSSVRIDNYDSISQASKNIQQRINNGTIPDEILFQINKIIVEYDDTKFSVRSSGVFEDNYDNSWAGQFDSFLHVDKNEIEIYIKKCWASFFNSRAISYNIRAYKGVKKLKFAIIVQKMVKSDKSGIAFSIDPKENDFTKIVIEATPGLGENLVTGKELPFTVILDKKGKIILNKSFKTNQYSNLLSLREINLLCEQVIKLEKKFNNPVDIEWSFEKDKLFFLQIRPITGLDRKVNLGKRNAHYPEISDYELTFKASGLSFLFTDILVNAYKYLNPLFTSVPSQFCQYITNEKIEYATKSGMQWLNSSNGFKTYQDNFTLYYNRSLPILNSIVENRNVSKSATYQFFRILSKYFKFYSRMDNYFTNLTYIYSDENSIIKNNLSLLSKFKDIARQWINTTVIDERGQFESFINCLCEEYSIKRTDIECYKIADIINLFHGTFLSDKEIANRKESFTIYFFKGQLSYLTGKSSTDFIAKITSRENTFLTSEIKGQVANKIQKIVKGKVRVINVNYGEIDKMNKEISDMVRDEILVSEFTAPELISACRKAKAIVTDLGGMLSHAAIVSRELDIPCLVGTINATKLLKTGDDITIDFDLGIVNKN